MISVEEKLIDTITATFHYLRTGKVPPPISIPDDLPDNEIRQLITYVNGFLTEFSIFAEGMDQIAQGEGFLRVVPRPTPFLRVAFRTEAFWRVVF